MDLLIVEDDELFLELVRTALAPRKVRVASTMREALEMIDQSAPETIILDLKLHDSTALQTLDRIQEIKTRSKNATVIVITGRHDIEKLAETVLKAGADCLLEKGVQFEGFFQRLSAEIVKSDAARARCASQSTVEQIESVVNRIVGQ